MLPTVIVQAQETDKPRNGEGIYAFLRRHHCDTTMLDQFVELNRGKLGKNNSLLMDVSYRIPSQAGNSRPTPAETAKETPNTPVQTPPKESVSAKPKAKETEPIPTSVPPADKPSPTKKEPLFGKKYEAYTLLSDRLTGATFYLSSGHGGPDCGATTKVDGHELHEDEYAYDVMLRLARNLMQEGATVHIIIQDAKDGIRDERYLKNSDRETCMGEKIPLSHKARLEQRSNQINALSAQSKAEYQRSLFIHLDSRDNKDQRLDVYFYYHPGSKTGEKTARSLRDVFEAQYKKHQPKRGFSGTVSPRDLFVTRHTKPVAVYTELANMQNKDDQRRYLDYNNRQAMANWLLRGFIADYEASK